MPKGACRCAASWCKKCAHHDLLYHKHSPRHPPTFHARSCSLCCFQTASISAACDAWPEDDSAGGQGHQLGSQSIASTIGSQVNVTRAPPAGPERRRRRPWWPATPPAAASAWRCSTCVPQRHAATGNVGAIDSASSPASVGARCLPLPQRLAHSISFPHTQTVAGSRAQRPSTTPPPLPPPPALDSLWHATCPRAGSADSPYRSPVAPEAAPPWAARPAGPSRRSAPALPRPWPRSRWPAGPPTRRSGPLPPPAAGAPGMRRPAARVRAWDGSETDGLGARRKGGGADRAT